MATPSRKSVALLFLGGATIDTRRRLGDTVTQASHVKPWLRAMSEMDIIADTSGVFIASGVEAIGIPEWERTASTIRDLYDEVDGFVVIHDLQTLPAAATALTLLLSSIGKPVVLCGSPLSQAEARTASAGGADFGTKASFINAVQVAVSDIAGVLVVYGSHMYRGETLVGPMHRAHGDVIGKIDFGIRFFGQHQRRHDRSWSVSSSFDTHVAVAEYLPGVDLRTVVHIPRGTKAVFISSAEGAGSMRQAVQQLRQSIPSTLLILMYTEPTVAVPGALSVSAPSRTAALLRSMWALGQTNDEKRLKKLLV